MTARDDRAADRDRDAPLPALHDVTLDAAGLAAHFAEVAGCDRLLAVATKRADGVHGEATVGPLAEALVDAARALAAGEVFAVQLRYERGGREWWDTLLRVPAGVRLVRIDHDPD